jgi:cyclohexanecarboxylate-CoA ligase
VAAAPERAGPRRPEGYLLDEARLRRERLRGIWPERVATDYLDRWAEEKPHATALVSWRLDEERETRLTWSELADRAARFAHVLADAGVGPGDVVSFQLPSWWEFIAVYLATVRLGAAANPLMPIFRQRELSFMLRQAEARVFIAPASFRGFDHGALARQLAGELPGLRVLLAGGDGAESLESRVAAADGSGFRRGARLQPDDVTQLLYTSGTTGESKGALHTSNTLLGAVHALPERMQLGGDDVIFMPSPLAHQLGFSYGMLMSLVLGVPLVLTDIWRPARAAQLIEAHGATFTFASTPFLADLAGLARGASGRLGRLRLFASSGAPIPPTVAQAARDRLDVAVAACWGMTECCSVTITPPDGSRATDSDGCALASGEVRVVDLQGREAPRGELGALQVRGASLFVGYLKRPHLYRLDPEGWFDTGDIARMDAEGYIRICGRSKDVIIRGGENIPVVEVEGALYRMPEVADAAVVAMPDPRLQERACAYVCLRPGTSLDLDTVCARLAQEGFSKHFWPERLEVLSEMPRTATGKIQKFVLRELAKSAAGAAQA